MCCVLYFRKSNLNKDGIPPCGATPNCLQQGPSKEHLKRNLWVEHQWINKKKPDNQPLDMWCSPWFHWVVHVPPGSSIRTQSASKRQLLKAERIRPSIHQTINSDTTNYCPYIIVRPSRSIHLPHPWILILIFRIMDLKRAQSNPDLGGFKPNAVNAVSPFKNTCGDIALLNVPQPITLLAPLVIPQQETIGCSTCLSAVRGSSKAHCHQFVFKSTSACARMHMRPVLRNLQMYFQEILSMFFNKGGLGHKAITSENYHLIWGKNLLAKIDTILEGHCCGRRKAWYIPFCNRTQNVYFGQ